MGKIISSFEHFEKLFPQSFNGSSGERVEALKNYFKNGGVVSLAKSPKQGWPKLLYPGTARVEEQIKDVEKLKGIFVKKQRDWQVKAVGARIYYLKNEVLKLSEPLYWKHLGKFLFDKDYKEDALLVKLPASLVVDKRWKPMIKTFVNDTEYRKQLVETVQHSFVYEKNKELALYAKELQEFRKDISSKKLGQINEKIASLDGELKTLQEILKWAKE
ncbi:MAG: hypothetical protein HYW50_05190 [Candidatus Diapherotrites archaeon]|nr:hypothetical protein [Candidatus Diapherotrites archaeon]